ncbi:GCD1 Nucleoside-diphosphate-sugar pyrophosphorylase [Venturia nashicola]|uniref:Translation initiation factor eIF2B subunit epsilon n=1 Tax=Venturia nashicola TaxID=86259 RepID=A0A4Z1P3J9_9PEZI|nr:GCD1 Nucleoside-diphosphate-sugar pyrophosphorylase [Venturia nashicola]
MKGDFLVVYGDLISTIDIAPALQQHKARRLANKDRIFTTVLTKAAGHNRAHGNYTPVFTINPQTSRLLQYDQLIRSGSSSGSEHAIPLSAELFSDHQELDIMTGLTDTGIDIYTVDVLALWQDSFDLQDPRRQFLKLALRDYELNNKTFYAHVTESGYSARIRDLSSFKTVSNDLISRRAYPFVPEMNMLSNQEFKLYRNKNYREVGVILHRQATVEKNSSIGQGTSIGADSFVTGSTIGRNCLIGRGVRIENSNIFDNTSIGEFTIIKDSVIAGEVVIGKRCEVLDRSVLSWSCRISDGISLNNKKITLRHNESAEDSGYFNIVGNKGKGIEYRPEGDDAADEDLGSISDVDSISTLHSEDSDLDLKFERECERTTSFISIDSEHAQESREFDKEASENILDALNRGVEPENMLLELNSFRSSTNSSLDQVRRAVASGLWTYLNSQSFSPKKLKEEVEKNQELVRRFTLNTKDQVDFLVLLQKDAAKMENPTLFRSLTFALASEDLVDAEGLKSWWDSERSMETEALSSIRQPTEDVVQAVLKQAEESDEESSEEEDEDSE